MTWNTPYLGTPSKHTTAFSDVSISGTLDADIAQFTDAVTMDSTLAVTGVTTLSAALNSASAISGGAITGTTGRFTSTLSADGQGRFSTVSTGNMQVATLEATSTSSLRGALTMFAAINSGSAISGGAIAGTTGDYGSTMSVRGVTTLHDALNSASAISGGAVAGSTGNYGSTMSIRGATTLHSTIGSASAISSGALSATSALFTDRISITAGAPITYLSGSSTTIVATTVVATKSTLTTHTNNAVQLGDIIVVGPSNLSEGVVLQAYASANSTITFAYSNVSAANAAQVAINCRYAVVRLLA